jgi:hypothetical protein
MARISTEGVNESVNLTATGEGNPFAADISSINDALAQKVKDIALRAQDSSYTLNLPAAAMTSDDLNAGQSLLLELGLLASLNGTIMVDLSDSGFGSTTLDLGNSIGFASGLKYEFIQVSNSSLQFGVQCKPGN